MLKKINYNELLLYFIYTLIPILVIFSIHHITLVDTLSKMGDGYFGQSYAYVSTTEINNSKFINISKCISGKYALTKDERQADGSTLRAIFFQKNYATLPLEKGRFFKAKDFSAGNNVAVIGKNLKSRIYQKNNTDYININNVPFRVIGILGYEKETILDNYIYINMLSDISLSSRLYMIDYFSKADSDSASAHFVNLLNQSGFEAELVSGGASYSDSIIERTLSSRLFIGEFIVMLLSFLLITIQWITKEKKKIAIQKLVGANTQNILTTYLMKLLKIILLTFTISLIICFVFYPYYIAFFVKGYLISLIVTILSFLCVLLNLLSSNLEEAIK